MIPRIQPRTFHIIDLEFDIWRYPVRLNGTEVDSQHSCTLKLIAHYIVVSIKDSLPTLPKTRVSQLTLNGPRACPRPDV